jgi:hypothetical protein
MIRMIAITDAATADAVEAGRADPALRDVSIARGAGLAALLAPIVKTGWLGASRVELVRRLGEDQARLESLLRLGPLLPCVDEARLDSPAEAEDLLDASQDILARTLKEFGALVQFQICVEWKPEAMLKARARDPELLARLDACGPDRAARGAVLGKFMNDLHKLLADEFRTKIAGAARDVVELPLSGEGGVVNLVALIDRAGEAALDGAVEAIDASCADALTIRYTGPLPPASFAGVDVKPCKAGDAEAARRLLGVGTTSSKSALREAFAARARAAHPDTAGPEAASAGADLSELKEAFNLLARIDRKTSAGGKPPALVSIRREGEIARRA